MSEHVPTKVSTLTDETVRLYLTDAFSSEFRHGYWLKEILRRESGNWLCVWERTLESFGKDFDWTPPPAATVHQDKP